ncbi:hypothetical protein CF319_g4328 [Tilletia indica]|nr:hypothetical protein CF319_g4328 [Tilletia indica]
MDANEAKVVAGVNLVNRGLTLRDAAKLSGASKETIRRRRSGTLARSELGTHGPQRLLEHEEAALVDFIIQMEASGFPLRQSDVEASAMALLAARWDDSTPPPSLGDRGRSTKGLSKANAEHFFSILESLVKEYNLTAKDIYSMDETGVQHGVCSKKFKYAGASGSRKNLATAKQDGSQELTTVIETISASGSALPATFVFKGKTLDMTLSLDSAQGSVFTSSESGWTNAIITQRWFEKVFLPYSRDRSGEGAQRLLIMDGHSSHFTLEMLKPARQHKVHVLSLPSHSTHGMAPLDRTCFSPLKVAWAECQRWEMFLTGVVRRDDVVRLYEGARAKALTAANITAGYASTGIWPLTGTKAIPESMFTPAALSEAEMEEAEREAFLSSTLAEALYDLAPQMRSARAKDAVLTASRRIREADAARTLMSSTLDQLRTHAAFLKAKPRAFRVAEPGYGQAQLWTLEECIARMEADKAAKAAEAERIEREREERQLRKEQKEKEKEEKKAATLAKKVEAARKKAEAQRVKDAKKEIEKKRKAELEASGGNKPAKRTRKNAPKNAESGSSAANNTPSDAPNSSVLQPTQLLNQ